MTKAQLVTVIFMALKHNKINAEAYKRLIALVDADKLAQAANECRKYGIL